MFTTRHDCALRYGYGAGSSEQPPMKSKKNNSLAGLLGHLGTWATHKAGGSPFASISGAVGIGGGHSAQTTKEAKTGADFPDTYCHLSRTDCPTLMGVGYVSDAVRLAWCSCGMRSMLVYITTMPNVLELQAYTGHGQRSLRGLKPLRVSKHWLHFVGTSCTHLHWCTRVL